MKDSLSSQNGFTYTMVYDVLVEKFGLITAAVYGRMERYAQQKKQLCTVSDSMIAAQLNISRDSVRRAKQALIEAGLLIDTTPELSGSAHHYKVVTCSTEQQVTEDTCSTEQQVTEDTCSTEQQAIKETIVKEKKRQVKKQASSRPPENIPECIQIFQSITKRYPRKSLWSDIQKLVGDDERDLSFWRKVVESWVEMGHNPTNADGMMDWFRKRKIPDKVRLELKNRYATSPDSYREMAQSNRESLPVVDDAEPEHKIIWKDVLKNDLGFYGRQFSTAVPLNFDGELLTVKLSHSQLDWYEKRIKDKVDSSIRPGVRVRFVNGMVRETA